MFYSIPLDMFMYDESYKGGGEMSIYKINNTDQFSLRWCVTDQPYETMIKGWLDDPHKPSVYFYGQLDTGWSNANWIFMGKWISIKNPLVLN